MGAPLQEWECVVDEVKRSSFWFRLWDLTDQTHGQVEQAEMIFDKVPDAERKYIQPGAVFNFRIFDGYYEIEFRKEVWTKEEIEEAGRYAEKLSSSLVKAE